MNTAAGRAIITATARAMFARPCGCAYLSDQLEDYLLPGLGSGSRYTKGVSQPWMKMTATTN